MILLRAAESPWALGQNIGTGYNSHRISLFFTNITARLPQIWLGLQEGLSTETVKNCVSKGPRLL